MDNFDEFNIGVLKKNEDVDKINKEFYGKFNYPWKPLLFQSLPNNGLLPILNNDIGYYGNPRIPENAKIWVAGCGTNQAVFTALKYPTCQVTGTDISTQSLNICRETGANLNLKNLTLIERSINNSGFENEFDYVICTGVIHHNADPKATLNKLSQAVKNDGVIELMVYNYYHRLLTTAVQKAIGHLTGFSENLAFKFQTAKKLIEKYPYKNIVSDFLQRFRGVSDAELADALFQPVEYSYTVESLNFMLNDCNLEYLLPCNNQFNRNNFNWHIKLNDIDLDTCYNESSDLDRWQTTNLLAMNNSPMLWFYLQRKDSVYKRKPEKQVCEGFLETRFEKFSTAANNFVLNQSIDKYQAGGTNVPFPLINNLTSQLAKSVLLAIDPSIPMKSILKNLNISPDFDNVNQIRNYLASVASPYIKSIN